jgi:hypothetical protein
MVSDWAYLEKERYPDFKMLVSSITEMLDYQMDLLISAPYNFNINRKVNDKPELDDLLRELEQLNEENKSNWNAYGIHGMARDKRFKKWIWNTLSFDTRHFMIYFDRSYDIFRIAKNAQAVKNTDLLVENFKTVGKLSGFRELWGFGRTLFFGEPRLFYRPPRVFKPLGDTFQYWETIDQFNRLDRTMKKEVPDDIITDILKRNSVVYEDHSNGKVFVRMCTSLDDKPFKTETVLDQVKQAVEEHLRQNDIAINWDTRPAPSKLLTRKSKIYKKIAALKSDDPVLKRYALSILKKCPEIDYQIYTVDTFTNKNEDRLVRMEAVDQMHLEDTWFLKYMPNLLKDDDPLIRLHTLRRLGYFMFRDPKPFLGSLIEALKDRDENVRIEAMTLLWHVRDISSLEPCIEAIKDLTIRVSSQAVDLLGYLKDEHAVKVLIDLARGNNPRLKRWAIWALEHQIKNDHSRDDIITIVKDIKAEMGNRPLYLGCP